MLNGFCAIFAGISVFCCIVCLSLFKYTKDDRDYWFKQYLELFKENKEVLEKWDATVKLCQKITNDNEAIINWNNRLVDVNADLRLEIYKMKENNNA